MNSKNKYILTLWNHVIVNLLNERKEIIKMFSFQFMKEKSQPFEK